MFTILDARIYQVRYRSGLTTAMPREGQLQSLVNSRFRETTKDFGHRIEVLVALGLRAGDTVLDYGCSWGYGSWQLKEAGFRVLSFDIGRPRLEYARTHLGCSTLETLEQVESLVNPVDCVFASHVLEHLPDPKTFWNDANRVLLEGGLVVCFVPNGAPEMEHVLGVQNYDKRWGKKHPLLLTPGSLLHMASASGYSGRVYSSPFDLRQPERTSEHDSCIGGELLLVARKGGSPSSE